MDGGRGKFSILPGNIHFKSTARTQSCDSSIFPRIWQRGQQAYDAVFALQKHLGDGRCDAEVAVNLKRWRDVEQVGINSATAIVANVHAIRRIKRLTNQRPRVIAFT